VKPLSAPELLDLVAYEKARGRYLPRVIEYKRARRVPVGDELTFVFESRETVRFQVQEMLRAERTVDDAGIQDELDVYNELIPRDGELSATLMIEIEDAAQVRSVLDRLIGIDEHVWLDVGDASVRARFDPKQFQQDRIAAVQFVRFPLGPALAARFRDPSVRARLRVDHPRLKAEAELRGEVHAALARDLSPDAEPSLLHPRGESPWRRTT
jgi:hypothetical protein